MQYLSNQNPMFRSKFSEDIFQQKYAHEGCESWIDLTKVLVEDVCRSNLDAVEKNRLIQYMSELKFIPGGRYLYYAGRKNKFFNNCFLLRSEEDNREDWAELSKKVELCLSTGGGIGNDYSIYRPSGSVLHGTGGIASGPLPKMQMVNEQGRGLMQGGSRRSAIYASLNWKHGDITEFIHMKDWYGMPVGNTGMSIGQIKEQDFNFPAPMDYTNISVNYDTEWIENYWETGDVGEVFKRNVKQALSTGEPGFSFNFWDKEKETLRNACTEVTSEDDSDVCNLGSINIGRIDSITEFKDIVELGTKFLMCGTLVAKLPYQKVNDVREKNRRLGLGIMGMHEWLIKKGSKYEVTPELHRWLSVYRSVSDSTSKSYADTLGVSRPAANRAIAPTGSIGILAGTALTLASDPERRIKFQADVQDYVDMSISSTINLPAWGTDTNNESNIDSFTDTLAKYSHRLRGFTCYPDGSRGGQPLVKVEYKDAVDKLGEEFEEHVEAVDICDITGKGGSCGV